MNFSVRELRYWAPALVSCRAVWWLRLVVIVWVSTGFLRLVYRSQWGAVLASH